MAWDDLPKPSPTSTSNTKRLSLGPPRRNRVSPHEEDEGVESSEAHSPPHERGSRMRVSRFSEGSASEDKARGGGGEGSPGWHLSQAETARYAYGLRVWV